MKESASTQEQRSNFWAIVCQRKVSKSTKTSFATMRPCNATDTSSFLGFAAYLSGYIPSFANLVKPLWNVVKDKPFAWSDQAEAAFNETKGQIAQCTTKLSFFSTKTQARI
jgi:hypothetical protein